MKHANPSPKGKIAYLHVRPRRGALRDRKGAEGEAHLALRNWIIYWGVWGVCSCEDVGE